MNQYIHFSVFLVIVGLSSVSNAWCSGFMPQVGPNGEIGVSKQQFSSDYGPRAYNSCLKRRSFIVASQCGQLNCEVINGRVVYTSMCQWIPQNIGFDSNCKIVRGPPGNGEKGINSIDRTRCFRQGHNCMIDDKGRKVMFGIGR